MTDSTAELLEQAVRLHRAGNVTAAEPLYRQVLANDPGSLDAEYLLGTTLLQLGRYDAAVTRLKSVAAKRPDADVHNNLGVAFKAVGDWDGAAGSFQRALKSDPDHEQALFNLGAVRHHRGEFTEAEHCYKRLLQRDPENVEVKQALENLHKARQADA